jgi:hypothetical protein
MHKHKIKSEKKNLLQPISTFSNNMETQKQETFWNRMWLNKSIFFFPSSFFNNFIFSYILNI